MKDTAQFASRFRHERSDADDQLMRSSAALTVVRVAALRSPRARSSARTSRPASRSPFSCASSGLSTCARSRSAAARRTFSSPAEHAARYHTGDLVLVERQSSYHVGQLISYRVPKGDPMAGAEVIHRIIGGARSTVHREATTAPRRTFGIRSLATSSAPRRCAFRTRSSSSSSSAPPSFSAARACFVFVQVLVRATTRPRS